MELDPVIIFGLILTLGYFVARGMRLISSPLVVGYVIAGLILGPSFTKLLLPSKAVFEGLDVISLIALAMTGFGIGTELEKKILQKLGKSIIWVTLAQSLGAFFLVSIGCYLVSKNMAISLILGALSSGTAPTATSEVLREYKAKGTLTSTLYAVVGWTMR